MCYSIIVGMIVPLGHGITGVSEMSCSLGSELALDISTYNTSYEEGSEDLRLWLKLDDHYSISIEDYEVLSVNKIRAHVVLPSGMPEGTFSRFLTLVVDHKGKGTAILPSALSLIEGTGVDSSDHLLSKASSWQRDAISNLSVRAAFTFPYRNILQETIRNTYYHVAFWMAMFFILSCAAYYSIDYLRSGNTFSDHKAMTLTQVGVVYGVIGLLTGMVWGKYTWGSAWPDDAKLNMTAISLMMYVAYFVLRSSVTETSQRARFSAAYNIFSYAAMFPLLFVIPRMVDSLHPGNGGNPAFGGEDLDNTMRMVFYPAIVGWILMGLWMAQINQRILRINFSTKIK